MTGARITVSLDADLGAAVRRAAQRDGVSVSAWIAGAAAALLRNELLGAALDAWQAEDGPFTEAELADAAALMQRSASGTPDAA